MMPLNQPKLEHKNDENKSKKDTYDELDRTLIIDIIIRLHSNFSDYL